jgi:beta-lactamase regulating signal transducer with metallopeptidase domain
MSSALILGSRIFSTDDLIGLGLDVALKGAVLLLICALTVRAMKRSSAAARHLIWTLSVVALLLLPAFVIALPEWKLPILPALASATAAAKPTTDVAEDDDLLLVLPAKTEHDVAALNPVHVQAETPAMGPVGPDEITLFLMTPFKYPQGVEGVGGDLEVPAAAGDYWMLAFLMIWAAGLIVVVARLVTASYRAWRIAQHAQSVEDLSWNSLSEDLSSELGLANRVRLLKSPDVSTPMTWGIFRPIIMLPISADDWSENCRRIVLLHELSHIKRRDCLTQGIAQLATAVHWFNPLVWTAVRRLRAEREVACDDLVLEAGTRATDYAGHLVAIAVSSGSNAATSPMTIGLACSELESRVRSILNPATRRIRIGKLRVGVTGLITLCLVAPFSAARFHPASADNKAMSLSQALSGADHARGLEREHEDAASRLGLPTVSALTLAAGRDADGVQRSIGAGTGDAPDQTAGATESEHRRHDIGNGNGSGSGVGDGDSHGPVGGGDGSDARNGNSGATSANSSQQPGQSTIRETNAGTGQVKGTPLTVDELATLRLAGVSAEYADSVRQMGFDRVSAAELIRLNRLQIDQGFVDQVRTWGFDRLTVNQLIHLKATGVTTDFVQAMEGAGLTSLTLNTLPGLKSMNVTPEFIDAMRRAGYDNLSANQLIQMRQLNIDEQFIRETQSWGYGRLDANQLIAARAFNVTPEYARQLKSAGLGDVPLQKMIHLKSQGVTADVVREYQSLGFTDLTADQLLRMKGTGVTPVYIRRMRAAGFTNVSAEQMIRIKSSGVDQILLRTSR